MAKTTKTAANDTQPTGDEAAQKITTRLGQMKSLMQKGRLVLIGDTFVFNLGVNKETGQPALQPAAKFTKKIAEEGQEKDDNIYLSTPEHITLFAVPKDFYDYAQSMSRQRFLKNFDRAMDDMLEASE